ncbi:MAG: hypothetical protein M3Q07_02685, partial [Pseudobdellovibrionaceae bacterium]|nr:hypothetical protein [Pseudobdellovibrionaceae bacterium]
MVSKRLPYAFVLASLMITCSKNDSDKRQGPVIPPVAGPGCSDVAEGQEKALTYYKKARAALNETCSNLALQVTATCQQGKLNIQGEGFPACDETVLSKVTIKATSTTVKVDEAPLLLTLEGVDQDGQTVVVDNSLATWTSSNELVTVTADGHVTAKAMVNDVVIKAVVKDLVAEVKVTAIVSVPPVVRKDCGEIKDGATKEFPRFKAALVNFQSKCESYQAQALCDNGEFVFKPEDSITECKVAPVKSFSVNPEALALKGGESRPVTVEAVDESEFKGALTFADVKWTVEAAAADQGKITVADGNIALSADLVEDASIQAQYLTFTKTISLAKVKIEPTRISFEKETYLLKNGDTLDLKVLGFASDKPVAVDSAKLVLESSDTQKVVIENNVAKVLTPGASVTITARYAGDAITAQTKLTIEDELKLETAATRDPKDEGTVTADHPYVTAAAQITLSGPSVEKTPVIVSKNEVCAFRIYLSQSRWMVDVNLKAAPSQVIPEACQAEVSVTSAAGQKPVQTVDVPVRFVSIDFKESMLKDASKPDNLIATLTYKLSSNVKLTNVAVVAHKIAELSPATCKFSAQQKDGVIEVLADITAAPETKFCAGFL